MSPSKRPVGNINRIREFELEKVILSEEFDILQIVGEGWFGKILLVEHKATDTEMVLKALPKPYVSLRDFYREFHYGLHLGVHKNIVTTYDVAFETAGFYVFTQEYATLGDLTSNVMDSGIGELHTKRVAKQIASALDFIHSKELVHRDVKLDNVLVFRSDFARVKLCDFGETRKANASVQRRNEWLPYSPPEVLVVNTDETYKTNQIHDIWQFGIVIFVCLTGCLPWQKAAIDDPRYNRYLVWHGSSIVNPIKKTPKLFKLISAKACRMFRKYLEPNSSRRAQNFADLAKFLDDKWLCKRAEKDVIASEPDELCASMYSFHSSVEEKNKLLSTLAEHGIETTVDRSAKKQRIRDWIQSSVITEEEEEADSGTTTPSSTHSRTPIAGHVSSIRATSEPGKKITSNIKDASKKHMDPRTGNIEQGPSRMGFDSNENMQKDCSHDDGSSNNTRKTTTRADNTNNNSFRGKKENGLNIVPSRRTHNEPSGSSQNLMYQSNNENFPVHPVMDSGYGSVDKLKMNRNGQIRSPVLTRRLSNKVVAHTVKQNGSSFDSDDVGSDGKGSSGFVHIVGVSSKDTAYDYVRMKK
ncbi:hypothetical protein HA402_000945 [Bradysia odoriphaga]|nr:hypothetical protein HA402_000945 [Bradysia odoriphaga]